MNKHVQIRDLDGEDHALLTQLAEAKKMSLSEFLRAELHKIAKRAKLPSVAARLLEAQPSNIASEDIVRWIHEAREERTDQILAATSLGKPVKR